MGEWGRNARRVRRLHEKLFYRPLLTAVSRLSVDTARLSEKEAAARLGALGWTSPEGALGHLRALTGGVSRAAAIQQTLLPVLLDELARSPDPDRGLLAYRRVSEALADTPWYLRLLRDEGLVAQRLMQLLGTSALVPDLLVRAPEVLRLLAAPTAGHVDELQRDPADVAASLLRTVARQTDPDGAAATARSLRRHELLRVACADLLGMLSPRQVCAALSSVWVAVLAGHAGIGAAVAGERRPRAARAVGRDRHGQARRGRAGLRQRRRRALRLRARRGRRRAATPCATRARWPRPCGAASARRARTRRWSSTPTCAPRAATGRWCARWSPTARTTRAGRRRGRRRRCCGRRPVAGDADLGVRFVEMVDPMRYPAEGLDQATVTEIRRIKARVDAERLPRGADRTLHTKLGLGGLADVEWTVQLLQLQHAGDLPELRTTSTLDGLREAGEAGLLSAEEASELAAAWTLATRARNAVMLVRGKPGDQLPRSGRELAAVA